MNRADLVTYVTQKTQLVTPDDITACQLFLSKRYELIFQSYLWKDSLVMVPIDFDPVNNSDNAEGIVILPEIINRVVAVRTIYNSVRVQGLEYYYRIDYDSFNQGTTNTFGAAAEFSILSPIWFVWRGFLGLQLNYSQPVTDTLPCKVTWQDENGKEYVTLMNDGALLNSVATPENIIPSGSVYDSMGNYTPPTVDGVAYYYQEPSVAPTRFVFNNAVQLAKNTYFVANTVTMLGPIGMTVTAELTTAESHITIESVFKPMTSGTVTLNPQITGDAAGGALSATDTKCPNYQRLRLFAIPSAALTLNVLGKRPFVPLDFDQEVPLIRNLDNALIAFTSGDMLKRARQYAKAQTEYTEGAALLKELALLEVVQAANYSQFVPSAGYGDVYFGPDSNGWYGWNY